MILAAYFRQSANKLIDPVSETAVSFRLIWRITQQIAYLAPFSSYLRFFSSMGYFLTRGNFTHFAPHPQIKNSQRENQKMHVQ